MIKGFCISSPPQTGNDDNILSMNHVNIRPTIFMIVIIYDNSINLSRLIFPASKVVT